jgi:hypothetical protein
MWIAEIISRSWCWLFRYDNKYRIHERIGKLDFIKIKNVCSGKKKKKKENVCSANDP